MPSRRSLWCLIKKTPDLVKEEINKHRKSTPFLISVSFLISLVIARIWVTLLDAYDSTAGDVSYSVGKNLVMSGYHIHHIAYGIILISIAAWLSINYWSKAISRISSVLFGAGLGLIVDEVGFIIGGIEPYEADTEVFYIAVMIIAFLVSLLYFPSFYETIKEDIKKWEKEVFK
ncbi:MAG: hypothetical protein R6U61_05545 [Thermoplasmata archaeon]